MTTWERQKLSTTHHLIALLDAMGKAPAEIATLINWERSSIYTFQSTDQYKLLVIEKRREVEDRMVDKTVDLFSRFDEMAPAAAETLDQLMKNADKDATRLGAAKDILDRAPSAPKARKLEEGSSSIHLHLSAKVMGGVKDALGDVGEEEVVALIEGDGFEVVEDGEIGVTRLDGGEDE